MKNIIGIDLGGTYIKMGLVTKGGHIVTRKKLVTPSGKNYNKVIDLIIENLPSKNVSGIGFGVPGLVDSERGIVHALVNIPGWKNVPLQKIIEKRTRIPAVIDNDVNCMVLGEAAFGAAKGKHDVFGITLGTGVGGGIIINGRIYRGSSFTAGEVGHVTVEKDGPRCNCGNRGCLEAIVGNKRIVARYKKGKKIKGNITPIMIQEAAEKGDQYAKKIWQETGEYIGIALAGIVNVLNPQLIVIGGGIAKAGDLLMNSIRATVKRRAMPVAREKVQIKFSKLGNDAGILGAAALIINR